MTNKQILPVPAVPSRAPAPSSRILTAAEFHQLAQVPAAAEWFANIDNPETRRAYENDVREFMRFTGITHPDEFRLVTRAHVLAWRKDLDRRGLAGSTRRRKLSALSSLFDYLCNEHTVLGNPVDGVLRPPVDSLKGRTPRLADKQARKLLDQPSADTVEGKRDRAILSTFLYHGPRRLEVSRLKVGDLVTDRGVTFLRVHGKGSKTRLIPLHPETAQRISDYLAVAPHGTDKSASLFQSVRKKTGRLAPTSIYESVRRHCQAAGISIKRFCHMCRATAATNALEHGADISRVRDWMGHADISTTQMYDQRNHRAQDSPTFKISY